MNKVAAGIGIAGTAIGLGYLAYTSGVFGKLDFSEGVNGFTVVISATKGGSTTPAPGLTRYSQVTIINLTAKPQTGYSFKGWLVNGKIISTSLQYNYTVSTASIITASFTEDGAPILLPQSIKPVQNTSTENLWRVMKGDKYDPYHVYVVSNKIYLESYQKLVGYVKFKLQDANGNGVPDQQIGLYTDPMPDTNEFGYLLLNDEVHFRSSQYPTMQDLVVTTDADGIALAKVTYWWYEGVDATYKASVGRFLRLHYISNTLWSGWYEPPIGNGDYTGNFTIVDRFERLQNPCFSLRNFVHAYWVDNPNLQVYGDCYVDCLVRLDPSGSVQVDPTRPYI